MKQAHEALTARVSAAGVMQKGSSSSKTFSRLKSMVDDLSDATVTSLSGLSTAEVETALFGSEASRNLLQSLIEKRTSVAGITKALGSSSSDLTYNPPAAVPDLGYAHL